MAEFIRHDQHVQVYVFSCHRLLAVAPKFVEQIYDNCLSVIVVLVGTDDELIEKSSVKEKRENCLTK